MTKPPQMRLQLAESAFDLFSVRGFQNVNLDEIAENAGVTKGSLYWHYKSKNELILAACSHYYRVWRQEAFAEIAEDSNPLSQLERVLRMSVQKCLFDEKNRQFTSELFAMSLQDDEIRASWAQFYASVRDLYVELVQAAIDAGLADVENPRQNVDWMLSALEGIKQRAAFEPEICGTEQWDSYTQGLLQLALGHAASVLAGT